MQKPIHILHLEDDPLDAELIHTTMDSAGFLFNITRVQTSQEFGDTLQRGGFGLILADFMLPDYDGMSAMHFAREHYPDIPFIFVSGIIGEDAAIQALTEGATDYVLKQKLSRLAPAVSRALRDAENRAERKRIEEALSASEEKYRTLFEESYDGLFITSPAGKILDMNKKGIMMFGYNTKEEILNLDLERDVYAYPLDRKRILAMVDAQGSVEYEIIVKKKSGETMVTHCSLTAVKDQLGVITSYRGILRDITERKKTEEQVHYQATLLANVNDAIVASDENYRLTAWNAAAESLYGWKAGEVLGRPGLEITQTDYQSVDKDEMLCAIALAGRWRGETTQVRKDGTRIPVEVSSIVLHDENGRITGYVSVNRDITERKEAEEKLKESEKRLRLTLEATQIGIWDWDIKNDRWFASSTYYTMLGYEPKMDYADRKKWLERLHPEDRASVNEKVQNVLTREFNDYHYEARMRHVDGSYRWQYVIGFGIERDQDGKVTRMLGTRIDINDRKLVEESLRESEEKFSSAFRFSPSAMSVSSVKTHIFLDVNERFLQMTGYTHPEVVGHTSIELNLWAEFEQSQQFGRLLQEQGSVQNFEHKYQRKDGGVRFGLTSATLITLGGENCILAQTNDITEKKMADERMRDNELRYRLIFDNVLDGLFLLEVTKDGHFRTIEVNPALERATGVPRTQSVGKTQEEIVPEEVAHLVNEKYRHCVEAGQPIEEEVELDLPTGRRFYHSTLIPAHDGTGRINRIIGISHDITEQKKYYEENQRRNQELEVLARLSSALRQAVTQNEMVPILLQETIITLQADGGILVLFPNFEVSPVICQQGQNTNELIHLFTPGSNYWDQAQNKSIWFFIPHLMEIVNALPDENPNISSIGTKSVVCAQLKTANDFMGLLVLGYSIPHEPSNSEQRLLESIIEIGGNALHRSGLMAMLEKRVADRTLELKTLYDISVIASQPLGLKVMMENILQKTMEAIHAQIATIYQMDPDDNQLSLISQISIPSIALIQTLPVTEDIRKWFENENEPLIINSAEGLRLPFLVSASEYHSCVHSPIQIERKTYGIMSFVWEHTQELTVENMVLLSSVAKRLAVAIQNDALHKRSEEAAVLEERHRLASELHDSVTQLLYGLTLLTNAGKDYLKINDFLRLRQCLDDLGSTALQSLKEMRLLLYELHASPAGREGLEIALRHRLENVEKRAGVQTELFIEGTISLSLNDQNELYLITCEALNNILKHAMASSVSVKLWSHEDDTMMEIYDNGIGFDATHLPETGMGLRNMEERAKRLRGELTITSESGMGTCVRICVSQNRCSSSLEEKDGE